MKVFIPNSASLQNIDYFLANIDTNDNTRLHISTHKDWINVHPLAVAMIAALGKSVDSKQISCDPITAPSGHYLKRIGLFDFLGINPVIKNIKEHELAGRLIPLVQIVTSTDQDKFIEDLVPLLHLDRDPKHAEAIQHIFSELIRNVLEHSKSTQGAIVCAQYYKRTNKIAIGVVDIGIGLKKSIQQSYTVLDDIRAIELALSPGITGTTNKPGGTSDNAGFGLFLIKSIAYVNSDFFTIISGDKMYKLLKRQEEALKLKANPFKDRHKISNIRGWQGVAVGVDISLNQTGGFAAIMDMIWRFYAHEVRDLKKQHYKHPKFT